MWIYILNFVSIPIYNFIFTNKKKLVILITLQMFLILAFRSETLGVDLDNYSIYYAAYKNCTFIEILKSMRIFGYADTAYGVESGYVLFNWIIGSLGFSFHSYLVICAFICMTSIGFFIYHYSEEPVISFVMFISLGGYGYFFGILRQSLGLAIFLFAIPAIKQQCIWKYFFIVIVASLFHTVFLFAIPLYLLSNIKVKSVHYVITIIGSVCISVLVPLVYNLVISNIFEVLGKLKLYELKFEWNNMFMLIILFAIFFNILGIESIENTIQWGFLMALPIQALGFYIPIFSRAAIGIFLCFAYVLIANVIKKQKIIYQTAFNMFFYTMGFTLYIYTLNGNHIVPYTSAL